MIEVAPGVRGFAVRSPTLPPATHTNVWILGHTALTVIDPASPWPEEQQALEQVLLSLDRPVERIVLTHHHHDHVSGAEALQRRFGVPIVAHPLTLDRVRFSGEAVLPGTHHWGGVDVDAVHTPGHAPGHLVFHAVDSGAVVAGDMVAGVGTIAIDPDDAGHLGTYLDSLRVLLELNAWRLLPAHGPVLDDPRALLQHYLQHRNGRTEQIRAALGASTSTPLELAPRVYPDLDPRFHPLAAVQIRAHLIWLEERGEVSVSSGRWRRADAGGPEHR